jgi:DNA-binding transcriptional LysR family regulator
MSINLRSMNLNLLVAFDALVEYRHVTRAGVKLGLSQSAMSGLLTQLRNTFNDELLVRTSSGMELTPLALDLVEPTKEALKQIERLFERNVAFEPASFTGTFKIRMGDVHGVLLLPSIINRLASDSPGVAITALHLSPEETVTALERDAIDLAISTDLQHPKFIQSTPLYSDRIVCVFRRGHPIAHEGMATETFLDLNHLRITQSPTDMRFVDGPLGKIGLVRRVALNVQSWLAAPHIVRNTDLVSVGWSRTVQLSNTDNALETSELPFGEPTYVYRLYWHKRNDGHPAHQWLRKLIIELCRPLNAEEA